MRYIHTEIEVQASCQRVWQVLTNLAEYSEWNSLIPEAVGELKTGGCLSVQIQPPGMRRSGYTLQVTALEPLREFRWLGHFGMPGLMDGDHRFLLEPLGDGRTRLIQCESFSGLLVPVCGLWLAGRMRRGFEMMNEALKQRAEARAAAPEDRPRNVRPIPGGLPRGVCREASFRGVVSGLKQSGPGVF